MSKDIKRCLSLIEDLLVEIEHIENIIDLFALGFDNLTRQENDCEKSSMYILGKLICQIKEDQILSLSNILESIDKNVVLESSVI